MEESNLKYLKKAQDRAPESLEKLRKDVEAIVANVAENGDEALKSYNEAFDGCKRRALRVSGAEIEAAYAGLDSGVFFFMSCNGINAVYCGRRRKGLQYPQDGCRTFTLY